MEKKLTLEDAINLLEQTLDTDGDFTILFHTYEDAVLDTLDILRNVRDKAEDVPKREREIFPGEREMELDNLLDAIIG